MKKVTPVQHTAPGEKPLRAQVVEFVLGMVNISQMPADNLPHLALLGRSNVGKSSLINALLDGRRLARTSATPGKTREINLFLVDNRFYLADLPGVGFAKVGGRTRAKMSEIIRFYVEKAKNLRGIVYLFDLRHGGMALDVEMVNTLRALGRPVLLVGTKNDKMNQAERTQALRKSRQVFGLDSDPLVVSSLHLHGLDSLWQTMQEVLEN